MQAIVYSNLTMKHEKHPVQFTIGFGFNGQLRYGRINNLDLNEERKILERLLETYRDIELFDTFKPYKGMETIAKHFLETIDGLSFIEVIENGTEKIIMSLGDIQ